MPTNEERREAACMVRSTGNQSPRMWQQIRGMLGMPKDCGIPQIREHLASLIEPEPERTCHVVATERKVSQTQTMVSKSCSFCGHVFGSEEHRPFLPGAGDEIVLDEVSIPNYCPNCGAKVVDEL